MSVNEVRAVAYSNKCESRRKRKISRRNRRLDRIANVTLAFSVTLLAVVSVMALIICI